MKPRKNRFFRSIDFRTTLCSGIVVTCLAVSAVALSSTAHAADITWADSAGNTTWTTDSTFGSAPASASWEGGSAPANSFTVDTAIFTSVSNAQPVLTVQTRIAGVDFQMAAGGLAMSGGGGSGNLFQIGATGINSSLQTSGTNTITNARILTSASAGTWNLFSSDDTASMSAFTFDSTVQLGQNLIVIGQRNSAVGNVGVINFERAITFATTTVDGVPVPVVRTLTINSSNTNNTVNLKGVNTYLGVTNVNGGIVNVQNDQTTATGGWNIQTNTPGTSNPAATVNFATGSEIAVISANKIQIGSTANGGSHPASTLNVAGTVTNSGALQLERASNLNLNSGTVWSQGGNLTVTGRGGSSATLNVNAGSDMTYSGSNTVKLSPSGNSSGNGSLNINSTGRFTTAAGFENIVSNTNTGNGRINLTNGGTLRLSADVANLTNEVNFNLGTGGGVIDNDGFDATLNGAVTAGYGTAGTGITGTGGLTSTGNGTLTLTGLNTYSGDTTVSSGTLTLDQINDSNEASTVSIASGAVLNLTFAGTDTVDKLFLNDVQQPVGVYGSGNSGGGITGTGTLTVSSGPASGYSSWITGFGLALADQDPSADPDNDGMNNLIEFVLNGNPSISDNSILPELVVTSTDFEFTYQRRDDSVSPETTQTFQWGTTLATWPGSAVIPATSGTVGVATITVSPGIPDDAVTDTVKISIPKTEAGASGTLFGRQQIVKP